MNWKFILTFSVTYLVLDTLGKWAGKQLKIWWNARKPLDYLPRFALNAIQKPWGREEVWAKTDKYVGKILTIQAGESLSLQYHRMKEETIRVLSGQLYLELERNGARTTLSLLPGQSYHLIPRTIHRMFAEVETQVLEVSTPELSDVVRLEDKYGRAGT